MFPGPVSLSSSPHSIYRNLDREDLDAIGIADSKHRDVLLGRTEPAAAAIPRRQTSVDRVRPPPVPEKKRSVTMEDPFDQFEAIFQDIDNMIEDIHIFQTNEVRGAWRHCIGMIPALQETPTPTQTRLGCLVW